MDLDDALGWRGAHVDQSALDGRTPVLQPVCVAASESNPPSMVHTAVVEALGQLAVVEALGQLAVVEALGQLAVVKPLGH
jgi:hypothetical protein